MTTFLFFQKLNLIVSCRAEAATYAYSHLFPIFLCTLIIDLANS